MKYAILLLLCVMPLSGCGAFTLANGNRVQMHEKIGITGTLQVVEETTKNAETGEWEYVGHEDYVGPGAFPMLTRAAAPIAAGRAGRSRTNVNVNNASSSIADATAAATGGAGGEGGVGGLGLGIGIGIVKPTFIPPGHRKHHDDDHDDDDDDDDDYDDD